MSTEDDPFLGVDFLMLQVARVEVERVDTTEMLTSLKRLLKEDFARRFQQRVSIGIDGYDNDTRELFEIPEVRTYMAKLDAEWPYWFYFLYPGPEVPSTLPWVALSLCRYEITPHGVRLEPVSSAPFLDAHFVAMNRISTWLGDFEERNKEMRDSIIACLFGQGPAEDDG